MRKPAQKHKASLGQIVPLILIGVGLIAIGLVLPGLLSSRSSTQEISVVPARVNYPAPELSLKDINGNTVKLSAYRQQIVLVNNWATWCPPCKLEMPTLQQYYQQHAGQGFTLIGIEAGDTVEDVTSFVNEYELTFPILLDPDEKALAAFRNDSLPSSYVIDRTGNVVLAWTGPIGKAMLEKYLTPLLEQ